MSEQLETEQIEDVEGQEPETVEPVEDVAGGEEQPEPEKAFDGEFDPQRARRTIDKLRAENKQLKKSSTAPDAQAVQTENLQLRAALKLGVPAEFASRLRGESVEEMIEDASVLLDALGVKEEAPRAPRREPRLLQGGSNPGKEPELSAAQVVDKAIGK